MTPHEQMPRYAERPFRMPGEEAMGKAIESLPQDTLGVQRINPALLELAGIEITGAELADRTIGILEAATEDQSELIQAVIRSRVPAILDATIKNERIKRDTQALLRERTDKDNYLPTLSVRRKSAKQWQRATRQTGPWKRR